MPPIYAIIAFFSYRFFRDYTYYALVQTGAFSLSYISRTTVLTSTPIEQTAYEAVTLSAFLLLIIEYVADTTVDSKAENAVARKDKRPLPFPFCFWRYRPTKPYFMYTIKVSRPSHPIFPVHRCLTRVRLLCVLVVCAAIRHHPPVRYHRWHYL